jgi:hypothetical protein
MIFVARAAVKTRDSRRQTRTHAGNNMFRFLFLLHLQFSQVLPYQIKCVPWPIAGSWCSTHTRTTDEAERAAPPTCSRPRLS